MNKCPLSYLPCGDEPYSPEGLRQLNRGLVSLEKWPFSAQEQRSEAAQRMQRMSIQGVQPKLGAVLNVAKSRFELAETGSTFLIKPQSDLWPSLPENEDLTMRMAAICGIETPWHGLIWCADGSLSYVIQRFDRLPKGKKRAVEDFAQLAGLARGTKYDFTTERMIRLIEANCTFPAIEKMTFFRRLLFCFLTGNEDMHLKNFSLIRRNDRLEFSPVYDLLNTSLAMGNQAREELALPLAGKRNRLLRRDWIDWLALEKLGLAPAAVGHLLEKMEAAFSPWLDLIRNSFLPDDLKTGYLKMLAERFDRLELKRGET